MSYKLLWIYFEKYRNSKALANQLDWFEKNIGIKWHDAHESDKTHTFFKSKSNRDKSAQQNFTYDFFDCSLCVCVFFCWVLFIWWWWWWLFHVTGEQDQCIFIHTKSQCWNKQGKKDWNFGKCCTTTTFYTP